MPVSLGRGRPTLGRPISRAICAQRDHLVHELEALGAVCDEQDRAAFGRGEHVVDERHGCVGVEVCGRLVEDEHRCIREQRAGDDEALALPSRIARGPPRRRACPSRREAYAPIPDPCRRSAFSISASVASGWPRRTFSRIVVVKRCESWPATAIVRRTSSWRYSRRSRPPRVTRPTSGSRKRTSRLTTVVFPAPLGPTRAIRRPGRGADRRRRARSPRRAVAGADAFERDGTAPAGAAAAPRDRRPPACGRRARARRRPRRGSRPARARPAGAAVPTRTRRGRAAPAWRSGPGRAVRQRGPRPRRRGRRRPSPR